MTYLKTTAVIKGLFKNFKADFFANIRSILFILFCFTGFIALELMYQNPIKESTEFQFAEFVRIEGKTAKHDYCEGLIRNDLGFGYYQVDSIWCRYKHPDAVGGFSTPSQIVHADKLKRYLKAEECAGGPICYGPAHEQDTERFIYMNNKYVAVDL